MDFFELCCNYNNYTDKYMELNFNSHNNQNNNRENKIKTNNINKKINNKNKFIKTFIGSPNTK